MTWRWIKGKKVKEGQRERKEGDRMIERERKERDRVIDRGKGKKEIE